MATASTAPRDMFAENIDDSALGSSELEDIVADALVRRGGMQIGLEPQWLRIDDARDRGIVTTLLLHPKAGKIIAARHGDIVRRLGLDVLAFYRRMSKVLVFQRELRRRGAVVACTVPAPALMLNDAALPEKLAEWVVGQGVEPAALDLKFENCASADLGPEFVAVLDRLAVIGFGTALDVIDLDGPVYVAALDAGRPKILVDGEALDAVHVARAEIELRHRLDTAARCGAIPAAWGLASKRHLRTAALLGFSRSGRFFSLDVVADCLRIANNR